MNPYFKLALATLLPAVVAVIVYLLDKKTACAKLPRAVKQILIGVLFGGLAILGTEAGVPINGAQINCRDAAVLIAGLMFGGPAGIIAGVIGGVERWIAVAWGIGTFTRVACSVSTLIAGIYSALLRKFMFDDKRPSWMLSFAIGVVMEVFHMTMVFITNMDNTTKAMAVVKSCTFPMVIGNALSVMVAAVLITIASRERLFGHNERRRISQTVQRRLLICVVAAFLATTGFMYALQTAIAETQATHLLNLAIDDVIGDIENASDTNLISLTKTVAAQIKDKPLGDLAKKYEIAEIDIVNKKGIITGSTNPDFVGFDMASGVQSAAFLCLLTNKTEYVQKYGPISYDRSISRKYGGVRTEDGFVQVAYDAVQFQRDIHSIVVDVTKNRHVSETGYVIVADESGRIVSAPAEYKWTTMHEAGFSDMAELPEPMTSQSHTIDGVDCMYMYSKAEGYIVLSVLPKDEAMQLRNIAMYVNSFMEVLVFAVMFAMIYQLIRSVIVKKMDRVNDSLAKITAGDLNEVVNVRSNAEFASLSDDINSTVDTLKRYIAEASARIDRELEFARTIQSSALPRMFPQRSDYEIYACMDTAKEVGGDFYDFYMTDDQSLHFLIADVSGKGIPAAMFMMRAKAELKSLTEAGLPINTVFTRGNDALCEGNDAGMFVTAWQGYLDLKSGLIRFANAGHNPPLVRHGDGTFEYLHSHAGLVLAGMEGLPYKMQTLQLEPGDTVFLYTDGVTEATNAHNELYGEERLQKALNARSFASMEELCAYVRADVDTFVGNADQFDDITMVALRYDGDGSAV